MPYEIKPASRKAVRPLVGFFAESGCGKTYSSLLLARGFVGPQGKIALIDSERGRGELYADDSLIAGYNTLQLSEPFSPENYMGAIKAVEDAGYSIGIIDSASHEWEGTGSVQDMAAANEDKSGRAGLHNWREPKMQHAKFLLRMLQSSIPWIVCMRAKHKTRQKKDERAKTVIVKDDYTSPIQAEDFIFEMTIHGEIMPDHSFRRTKTGPAALTSCFPDNAPITIQHGAMLAVWCAGGAAPATTKTDKTTAKPKSAKQLVWEATGLIAGLDKNENATALYLWIVDHGIAPDTEDLSAATPERWAEILKAVEGVQK